MCIKSVGYEDEETGGGACGGLGGPFWSFSGFPSSGALPAIKAASSASESIRLRTSYSSSSSSSSEIPWISCTRQEARGGGERERERESGYVTVGDCWPSSRPGPYLGYSCLDRCEQAVVSFWPHSRVVDGLGDFHCVFFTLRFWNQVGD